LGRKAARPTTESKDSEPKENAALYEVCYAVENMIVLLLKN
jgi:hypothetical protein